MEEDQNKITNSSLLENMLMAKKSKENLFILSMSMKATSRTTSSREKAKSTISSKASLTKDISGTESSTAKASSHSKISSSTRESFKTATTMVKVLCYLKADKSFKASSKTAPKMARDGSKPLTDIRFLPNGETIIAMERVLLKPKAMKLRPNGNKANLSTIENFILIISIIFL
jgi:hypothetical protein